MSRETRRRRVALDASGDGCSPSFSRRARMKLSMGLRGQEDCFTAGVAGRTGAMYAQCLTGDLISETGAMESGPGAPASIHCWIVCISESASGGPPYGMRGNSSPRSLRTSRLDADLPGVTILPESLPLRSEASESTRSPFCWTPAP